MFRPILVHTLDHARQALEAAQMLGVPLTLCSAPGAAQAAGSLYFAAMMQQAQAEYPSVDCRFIIDCGNDTQTALQALRCGHTYLRVNIPEALEQKLQDIAAARHVTLLDDDSEALDLLTCRDVSAACHHWLGEDCKA